MTDFKFWSFKSTIIEFILFLMERISLKKTLNCQFNNILFN